MTSRNQVTLALSHQQPDYVPLDLGASAVTGMHVQSVYNLRQALGLDPPGTPVKIIEPAQNLGEIKPDLIEILGVDVIGIDPPTTFFGFRNEHWKEWEAFSGTPVLVPEGYNTTPESNGDVLMYPEGDRSVPPSGRMPANGWYFDTIIRQSPIDENNLNPDDNLVEFQEISDEDLDYYKLEIERLYTQTDKAIVVDFGGTSFGDISHVPAPWCKKTKGIRDVEEWYISLVNRQDYINKVFERQCDIALSNLIKIHTVVWNRITAIYMSGTDLGTQRGPFISRNTYRNLFFPHQKRLNDWIHKNTAWKTFMHSCGSIQALISDFIEAGFDIINPVQWTAANMNPKDLKDTYGRQITFWGGGVDTQKTLPFGEPRQVRYEVARSIDILGCGGGFVFSAIHNIQPMVPVENIITLFNTFQEYR